MSGRLFGAADSGPKNLQGDPQEGCHSYENVTIRESPSSTSLVGEVKFTADFLVLMDIFHSVPIYTLW